MTTEQTAEQLELAAQILRTGHPWKSYPQAPDTDIYSALRDGFEIRPILATPPDGRPLHNPNNLTGEQVGIGYRLMTLDEKLNTKTDLQTKWKDGGWCWCGEIYGKLDHKTHPTYRLPLSVPWSEPGDTYANLRAAHAAGKVIEWRFKDGSEQWIAKTANFNEFSSICEYRIKPEPVFQLPPAPPGMEGHRKDGWRYADEKKTVPLGPEDVPPGSVVSGPADGTEVWAAVITVVSRGIGITDGRCISYKPLKEDGWIINRSIPLTGKWNPDAWEPCHKSISENG